MRRIGWMFLVVLGSAAYMLSQSSTNSMKLSGTVCQASCVSSVGKAMVATCDPLCTDKGGEAVLVDDQGNVKKIANPEMCKSHMGKHVKMTAMQVDQPAAAATPTEKQREQTLRIMELYEDPGGGY
jgi:hypothetical protein